MDKKQLLGLIGSIMLIIGVFIPYLVVYTYSLKSLSTIEIVSFSFSFFKIYPIYGCIILILASLGLIGTILRKHITLLIAGIGSLGVFIYGFITRVVLFREILKILKILSWKNRIIIFCDIFFGLAFLIILKIGTLLMLISALIKEKKDFNNIS